MRLLISGTRHAGTAEHRRLVEDAILTAVWASTRVRAPHTLVHGGAAGVDRIAAELARGWGWVVESRPADWGSRGKAAGPLRNAQLVAAGADLVLAFPSTGESRGTWDLVRKAVAAGLRVHIRPLVVEEATLRSPDPPPCRYRWLAEMGDEGHHQCLESQGHAVPHRCECRAAEEVTGHVDTAA